MRASAEDIPHLKPGGIHSPVIRVNVEVRVVVSHVSEALYDLCPDAEARHEVFHVAQALRRPHCDSLGIQSRRVVHGHVLQPAGRLHTGKGGEHAHRPPQPLLEVGFGARLSSPDLEPRSGRPRHDDNWEFLPQAFLPLLQPRTLGLGQDSRVVHQRVVDCVEGEVRDLEVRQLLPLRHEGVTDLGDLLDGVKIKVK